MATLAALAVAAGKPRQAVRSLRTHAETLQRDDNWHSIRDRAPRLMRAALLIAEQHSPAVTERQRLRQVTPGDVIVFLHPELDGDADLIDRVLLVLGPAQYVHAGTTPRAERFVIPVNDITEARTTSGLLMVDTARFHLTTLDHAVPGHVHSEPRVAADSWAVLPPDAIGMSHAALADRARVASRRAANAFDATPDLPHPN